MRHMSRFSNQILVGIIALLMVSIGITALAYISSNRTIAALTKLSLDLNPARTKLDMLGRLIQDTNLTFLQFSKLDYVHDAQLQRVIDLLVQQIQITTSRTPQPLARHELARKRLAQLPQMLTRIMQAKPTSLSDVANWQMHYALVETNLAELRTLIRRIETEEQAVSNTVIDSSFLTHIERLLFDYDHQPPISAAQIVMSIDQAGQMIGAFVGGAGDIGLSKYAGEVDQLKAALLRFKSAVILYDDEIGLNVSGGSLAEIIGTVDRARKVAFGNLDKLKSLVESRITEIHNEEIAKGNQRQKLLLLFAVIAVLVAGATAIFMRAIMRSNINRVVEGTRKIAEGDLRFRLKENKFDEFQAITGAVNDMVGTLDDTISALELAKIDAAQARQNAEEANLMKSRFLANMSHEIRTPLNAIIGFSEIMKMQMFGRLGAIEYRQYAADIADSGTHLLSLINSILDLSKIEAGGTSFVDVDLGMDQLVSGAIKSIEGHAARKQIKIVKNTAANLPLFIGDMTAITQVLLNLMSNAVKYTDTGGTITIDLVINEAGGHQVTVSDTGVGIVQKDLELVMSPFGRSRNIMTENEGGTGLGLSICQALVEQHDGKLTLASEFGVGTTVTISFLINRVSRRTPNTFGRTTV